MDGYLGGLGGRFPQNLRWGRPMHPSTSCIISRSSVIGCVRKYELSKKRCNGEFFCSEIEVFRQERGHVICRISDSGDRQKTKYGR